MPVLDDALQSPLPKAICAMELKCPSDKLLPGPPNNAFKAKQRKLHGHMKPVTKSINKATGKVSYSGNRALKETQMLSQLLTFEARVLDAACMMVCIAI